MCREKSTSVLATAREIAARFFSFFFFDDDFDSAGSTAGTWEKGEGGGLNGEASLRNDLLLLLLPMVILLRPLLLCPAESPDSLTPESARPSTYFPFLPLHLSRHPTSFPDRENLPLFLQPGSQPLVSIPIPSLSPHPNTPSLPGTARSTDPNETRPTNG